MVELSVKQEQVLKLFINGVSMREVSLMVGVSYSRVINILNEILVKTGYKSRKELLVHGKDLKYTLK